jgi:serine/threonine protein kinase
MATPRDRSIGRDRDKKHAKANLFSRKKMSELPPINTNSNLTSADKKSTSPNVVGVHYRVGRKIGEGSFGVIYEGINLLNNSPVAIKFEPRKADAPQLRDEYRTYKILQDCRNSFIFNFSWNSNGALLWSRGFT